MAKVQLTVQQRLNMLCTVVDNVRGQLTSVEDLLDGIRQQIGMSPHFRDDDGDEDEDEGEGEDEDDPDDDNEADEVEQPRFVYAIRARTNVKGKGKSQTVYLRKSPIKTNGWRKWWAESVSDPSVNLCANPKQQRVYMDDLPQLNPSAVQSVHDLALHKIGNPLHEDERGYVIVDPNPPSMKGTAHYYTGESDCDGNYQDNEDRRDMEWSSRAREAEVYETEETALDEIRIIAREKRKYWGKHSTGLIVKPKSYFR